MVRLATVRSKLHVRVVSRLAAVPKRFTDRVFHAHPTGPVEPGANRNAGKNPAASDVFIAMGKHSPGNRSVRLVAWVAVAWTSACSPAPLARPATLPPESSILVATAVSPPTPALAPEAPAPTLQTFPLFVAYPGLAATLPRFPIDNDPSPVQRVEAIEAELGFSGFFVKRDDVLGSPFGGTKARKLEMLLGEAKAKGASEVLTFGGVGSNHALATAIHARAAGLSVTLLLLPEPNTPHVRDNLLALASQGAALRMTGPDRVDALVRAAERSGAPPNPYVIAPGGTSATGNVGCVNAVFELAGQVAEGLLPRPDVIYVPSGTMGLAAGLSVGLEALGWQTQVRAVRVSSTRYVSPARLERLFDQTAGLLRARDSSFPALRLSKERVVIVHHAAGAGYALPTTAAREATTWFGARAGLPLDLTYTAKSAAAMLREAAIWRGKVVLFWNTYDARRVGAGDATPADLPEELRGWFVGTR
jgi:D-cysteine desulfhydrase